MWYDVNAKIEISSTPGILPYGCEILKEGKKNFALIKWSDEGFDANIYADVLKLAKRRGKFNVIMSDHQGTRTFKVSFGPNHFEEE